MKKFLTVLLALSVVFTYSFSAVGSAFAATASEVAAERAKMESAVDAYVGSIGFNASGYVTSLPQSATTSIVVDSNITKAAVDAVAVVIKDKYNGEITKADAAGTDLDDAWEDINTSAKLETEFFTTQAVALYAKVIADTVAAFEAKVASYVVNDYPTTNQTALTSAIADANTAIAAAKGGNTKKASDSLHGAITTFNGAVATLKTKVQYEADLTAAKNAAASDIDALAAEFKPLAITHYNDVLSNATNPTDIANAQAQKATLNANVNALVDLYKTQIAEVSYDDTKAYAANDANKGLVDAIKAKATAAFTTTSFTGYETAVSNLNDAKILIAYAKSIAEQKKQEYDPTTGLAKYTAETVEKTLKAVTAEIYDGKIKATTAIINAFDDMKTAADSASTLAAAKVEAIKDITGTYTDAEVTGGKSNAYKITGWEGKNAEKVEAIQNEYVAKIEAATTEAEIDALAAEAKGKMDKIADKTELTRTDIWNELKALTYVNNGTAGTVFDPATDVVLGSLEVYANTIAAKNTAAQDKAKKAVVETAVDFLVEKALDQYDATTAAANKSAAVQKVLQANYADALKIIDGMKTDAEIADSAKAIRDAIAALPTNVTLDAKAQYLDVQKALETYDANKYPRADISNLSLFTAYMTKLVKLEKDAAQALISALPANATLADKAAVDAAQAAADAYKDAYGAYGAGDYNYGYGTLNTAKLDAAVEAVANAMVVDAAKKIAALPVNVTEANKADIEAARAAYDALTDAQKATFNKDLLAKLEGAEKLLAVISLKSVETLKITASSTAAKGSITVKWTVKGDTSAADGFEVFRSVKKNSGFTNKAFFTTDNNAKRSYKNTKSLKKGTRYYYKVRAYKVQEDGTKLYSDWSNKAYRIAK